MDLRALALMAPLTLTLAAAAPAFAQSQVMQGSVPVLCHKFTEIAKELGDRYKEAPVSVGLQSNGNLLQIFASKESGSWTLLSTSPTGLTCVLAAGKSWESMPFAVEGPAA